MILHLVKYLKRVCKIFQQNPGGAPANVLVAAGNFGAKTAFLIGKVGKDMHGEFLREILEKYNIETKGLIMDEKVFTTLAFVSLNEKGERTFSFARKPRSSYLFNERRSQFRTYKKK